jgi:hypothetical protein
MEVSSMDLFDEKANNKKEKPHLPSIEIFARKKGRASKRYGTKKPIEDVKKDKLIAWREDL